MSDTEQSRECQTQVVVHGRPLHHRHYRRHCTDGFEHTAAEEVKEKIGVEAKISKDRGRIYFSITTDSLSLVHRLRSVDNLFVVVEEYDHYHFKESKVWKLNRSFKKKKVIAEEAINSKLSLRVRTRMQQSWRMSKRSSHLRLKLSEDQPNADQEEPSEAKVLKFRVTCSRAGDKHSFSSNEAARDFGGAVQEHFLWKADMTKFDIEVLLNIHNEEVVIGIALQKKVYTGEISVTLDLPPSLHSVLWNVKVCKPQPSDIILDPMCGTGAIPLEGAIEFNNAFYIAGDNNDMAVNRTVNNVFHFQKQRVEKGW
ncbi:hypothetical protein WMY93_012467 [Mugilogobius chulae]|uniref:THUMP domain-containing protein n=1 Tax=Mugilogobius chulae TaxID=88201 RepID=A0AAW0P8R2_9GOBI